MPLSRKSIILTGAGRGIGRAVATKLASEGARLALVARTEKEIQETYELIKDQSPASFFIKADISSRISLNEAFSVIKSQMDAIDVLINNAGIQQPIGLFHENNMDDWEQNIKTNLLGPANFIYLVLPIMIKQRKGKIINFSGGGATGTRPNFSAYAVAKTAIVRLTENLADEYRMWNIDVNAISPGAVNTKMLDEVISASQKSGKELSEALKRKEQGGTDLSIPANLVAFLASDASDGITGRLISAPWDPWAKKEFIDSLRLVEDICTLRRIDNKFFKKI